MTFYLFGNQKKQFDLLWYYLVFYRMESNWSWKEQL